MAHARKRPNHHQQPFSSQQQQSAITTYFPRVDHTTPPTIDPYDRANIPSFRAPLPPSIQSSLLTVGLRIRKSVPEGYKTDKSLFFSSSAPPQQENVAPAPAPAPPHSSAPATYAPRPAELAPFCGLHKVGGYASQPTPDLTFSQSTISSQQLLLRSPAVPAAKNERKRSYDEDIEEELDAIFDDEERDAEGEGEGALKARFPLSHSSMSMLGGGVGEAALRSGSRPKARMRARGGGIGGGAALKDFDDEDVTFLQPMECD